MSKRSVTKSEIVKHFTLKELTAPPAASLTIDQMGDYMRGQVDAIGAHLKKVALHTYYLGEALVTTREMFKTEKRRDWTEYLDDIGISPATATRARQLYDWASPEDLAGMGVTEAYRIFGILPLPKQLTDEKSKTGKAGTEEAKAGKDKTGEITTVETTPVKVEQPTSDKAPPTMTLVADNDLAEEELDDALDISETGESSDKFDEFSEDDEDQSDESSEAQAIQVEFSVALGDVTEAEMDAFTKFVKAAGNLERAKAIFKTCVESRSDLYAD